MKNIMKNRLALSTVVTTLIILVVSVLLAGVVTYFAINVTSTRVQEESLSVSNQHLWVSGTDGAAVGAMTVTNTGGRDVVLSKITVRGQASAWTNVYSNSSAIDSDIAYAATPGSDFAVASGQLVLPAGSTMGIMITAPDSISINDIGMTVAFTVFTSQAMYYKETNIQAAP
jgi:heme/copper-type cytochrome/quinol oxidase subunit 2